MISSEVFTKLPSMLKLLLTQQDTLPGPELGMQVHCLSCLWSAMTQFKKKQNFLLSVYQILNYEIWNKSHNYLPLHFPANTLLRCFFLWSSCWHWFWKKWNQTNDSNICKKQKMNYLLNVLNQWFLNFKIHFLYSFNEMLFIFTLKETL